MTFPSAENVIRLFKDEWMYNFGIPNVVTYNTGSRFVNKIFVTWCNEFGIELNAKTAHTSPTNELEEPKKTFLDRFIEVFVDDNKENWSRNVKDFAFAINTQTIDNLDYTPYEIMFGFKPVIPMNLKLGLLRANTKDCHQQDASFCEDMPNHTHTNGLEQNEYFQNKFNHVKIDEYVLDDEQNMKETYSNISFTMANTNEEKQMKRNKSRLGKNLDIGQQVYACDKQVPLGYSRKLKAYRHGPYTITKKLSNVTYKIRNSDDSTEQEIEIHRNNLIPYYPKRGEIPPLIQKFQLEHDLNAILGSEQLPEELRPLAEEQVFFPEQYKFPSTSSKTKTAPTRSTVQNTNESHKFTTQKVNIDNAILNKMTHQDMPRRDPTKEFKAKTTDIDENLLRKMFTRNYQSTFDTSPTDKVTEQKRFNTQKFVQDEVLRSPNPEQYFRKNAPKPNRSASSKKTLPEFVQKKNEQLQRQRHTAEHGNKENSQTGYKSKLRSRPEVNYQDY